MMIGRIFLGRYETIRLLGEGGMGQVYLARQTDLGRQVVVKVMHDHLAADPMFCERFQRETLLMARFQHPYVITLFDASLNDPQGPCIIMEYIRGVSMDTLAKRNGKLSPARVGRLLGQLCEALQAAHQQRIIHRDLKPANLMVVDPDTPYEKIKVMDFGLAKLVQPTNKKMMNDTAAEFTFGTPGYICPEQIRGEEMDHRGDIYSVGVILFELLSGRVPFHGKTSMDVMIAHATEEPPSFDQVGVGDWVPTSVELVVRKCLAKKPEDRPNSARELAEMYEAALAEQEQEIVPSRLPSPSDPQRLPSEQTSSAADAVPADPNSIVHTLEAWMPERIAAHKLRGFVGDVGGEIVESVPGLIRVRLGARGSVYHVPGRGPLSWLGLANNTGLVEMVLRLERPDASRDSLLRITVTMKSSNSKTTVNSAWRSRCNEIFCDLRGYLMGSNSGIS